MTGFLSDNPLIVIDISLSLSHFLTLTIGSVSFSFPVIAFSLFLFSLCMIQKIVVFILLFGMFLSAVAVASSLNGGF